MPNMTTDIIRAYPKDPADVLIARVWRDHKIKLTSSQIYNVRSRDKVREAAGKPRRVSGHAKRVDEVYKRLLAAAKDLPSYDRTLLPQKTYRQKQREYFKHLQEQNEKITAEAKENELKWRKASDELINLMAHLGLDRSEQLLEQLRAQWGAIRWS